MTINEFKANLLGELAWLRLRTPDRRAFASSAILIDVLAHATMSPKLDNNQRFQEFISCYMSRSYCSFRYANGLQDLPMQMYAILRCSLIHAFSLTPLPRRDKKPTSGRKNSILISADGVHLGRVLDPPYDAALFVFSPFLNDIESALLEAFSQAERDRGLKHRIERHIRIHSPVIPLPPLSFIASGCDVGTSITATASGSA